MSRDTKRDVVQDAGTMFDTKKNIYNKNNCRLFSVLNYFICK